jgi:LTXXQ motif family protein
VHHESGAGKKALPVSWRAVDRAEDCSRTRRPGGTVRVGTDLCSSQVAGLTDWPIEQIAQTVEPDEAQRALLDDVRAASAKAIDTLKAACPTDLPSTPTGRIEAMHARLSAMLDAVRTVRPAFEKLYQSLNDEQKARLTIQSSPWLDFNKPGPGATLSVIWAAQARCPPWMSRSG